MVWTDTWVKVDDLGGAKKAVEDFKMERHDNVSKHQARVWKEVLSESE